MNGEIFHINDAAAFVAKIDKELEDTTRENVDLVRKGRLTQLEADYVTGLIRDIRSDLVHAFGPIALGSSFERADPAVSWSSKVRWINGELEAREAGYPELVAKGRMTQAEARLRVRIVAELRRLYWRELFMWDPEPGPALDFMRATRQTPPLGLEEFEARHGAGRRLYRELLRRHVAALELEEGGQGQLVA